MEKPPPEFTADRGILPPRIEDAQRPACKSRNDHPDLEKTASIKRGRKAPGMMRPLPAYGVFPVDLPITAEEIHKVLAALGPELATLFEGD